MQNYRGFTIVELLIVLVVVGILAAIAIPSYNDQTERARRADGKAFLMQLTGLQERFFTQYISYTSVLVGTGGCSGVACGLNLASNQSPDGFFTASVTLGPSGCAPNSANLCRTYELTVTPKVAESKCATLSLTNTGQKKSTGTGGNDYCWR